MKRSFGLDLIRALSITIVILRHYRISEGFKYGFYAMEFLFVVSGYLIGQVLLREFYLKEKISFQAVKKFMIRRWFRILPLYYFAILVKFLIVKGVGWNILYYVFFLQNHFGGISFYPVTWTLVIDEWFYLGTPIMLYAFMKLFGSAKARVLAFLVFVVVSINILRIIWVHYSGAPFESLVGNVPLRQDTLLIGVIFAFIKIHYQSIFQWLNQRWIFVCSLSAFFAYVYLIYLIRGGAVDHIDDYFWTRTVSFALCAFLISMTMPYFENSVLAFSNPKLFSINRIVVFISKLSYALYLFHLEILEGFRYLFPEMDSTMWLRNIICIVITVSFSYFIYNVLEKRFLIIRDKYFPDEHAAKPLYKV